MTTTDHQPRTVKVADGHDWQVRIADVLAEAGVTVAAYVPDSRLDGIIRSLGARDVLLRNLTREEECVAYACGQRIAGARPVVLMQSSGLGNALNALGSLAVPYRLGLPLVVSMRGTLGEKNPSQVPLGRAADKLLAALGVQAFEVSRPAAVAETMTGVLDLAFGADETAALLLGPQLGGQRA